MYIDKSFQLLSADSGKVATDDTRRQTAGEDDAEFGELLDAELNQQEQQKEAENAVGTDKKTGQEIAALLTKQTKTAEQMTAEKSLADKAKAAVAGVGEATDALSNADKADTGSGTSLDVIAAALTAATSQTDAASDAETVADFANEQAADSSPWLAIISQSHDFNEILSQSSQQSTAATQGAALSSTETLVAELLGVPVTEKATVDGPAVTIAGQTTETVDSQSNGAASGVASHGGAAKNPLDTTLLNIAEGGQDASAQAKAGSTDVVSDSSDSGSSKSTKLSSEQMTLREMLKADQPHLQSQVAGTGDQDAVAGTAQQAASGDFAAASGAATTGQATQLQISAGAVAGQQNQVESNTSKNPATAPVDIELPIEVSPEVAAFSSVVAAATTTTPSAKNAPQSFAQFQKTANAAAALMQKQQLQAEQTQQPLQDIAAQQPQKFAELNQTLAGAYSEAPTAFNTLLQTDRPMSSNGGAMGSSTGQQQQQAASQLFATKLNDSVHSSEQPALNLLEPNAAGQLKERVMFQVNQKIQSAEIKLAPEELGTMQIKVQLQQEQLSVQFVVQQAGAKEALEQQIPRLREMLEEQGIELKDGQVSQQREGSDEQRQARERNHVQGKGAALDEEPLQQQAMVRVSDRMVDYYA